MPASGSTGRHRLPRHRAACRLRLLPVLPARSYCRGITLQGRLRAAGSAADLGAGRSDRCETVIPAMTAGIPPGQRCDRGAESLPGIDALGGRVATGRTGGSRLDRVIAGLMSCSVRSQSGQVTVPDGWHPRVEPTGLAEKFLNSLVVTVGIGGLSVQDQPAGGDLLLVLLPQVGTAGIQGGSRSVSCRAASKGSGPVGLVGGHCGTVGSRARTVSLRSRRGRLGGARSGEVGRARG